MILQVRVTDEVIAHQLPSDEISTGGISRDGREGMNGNVDRPRPDSHMYLV
jgi:hypothetical protein